ncbi:hypothetical protein ACA910_001513 [Epithemia clementina (nom. ined.)]
MGNVDETTYATTPDWKISLTPLGIQQAQKAGAELKTLLLQQQQRSPHKQQQQQQQQQQQSVGVKDEHPQHETQPPLVLAYCSPYHRTLQTWKEIQRQLHNTTNNNNNHNHHHRKNDTQTKKEEDDDDEKKPRSWIQVIGMRQEPRLAEQQFGNFQNPAKVLASKEERHAFGRFFYRFPNGESGLDVYSRVTSFLGSLNRDMVLLQKNSRLSAAHNNNNNNNNNVNIVCVTHGLTMRLFLMRYFQLSVSEFEETTNPPNGQVVVMQREYCPATNHYFYRLQEESKKVLNLKGDISTEIPVFWRNNKKNNNNNNNNKMADDLLEPTNPNDFDFP